MLKQGTCEHVWGGIEYQRKRCNDSAKMKFIKYAFYVHGIIFGVVCLCAKNLLIALSGSFVKFPASLHIRLPVGLI